MVGPDKEEEAIMPGFLEEVTLGKQLPTLGVGPGSLTLIMRIVLDQELNYLDTRSVLCHTLTSKPLFSSTTKVLNKKNNLLVKVVFL